MATHPEQYSLIYCRTEELRAHPRQPPFRATPVQDPVLVLELVIQLDPCEHVQSYVRSAPTTDPGPHLSQHLQNTTIAFYTFVTVLDGRVRTQGVRKTHITFQVMQFVTNHE